MKDFTTASLAVEYEIDDSFDSDKFIKMRLRVCHDGENPNGSDFEATDMEEAKDSIKNIPILANVIFDENGNPQFGGHDYKYEDSKIKEGELKLIYEETPIGVIPEDCNHEIKEYNDKQYVFADAYIWRDYSNYAEDIIERDKDIKLSMEIIVDEYSYDGKKKKYKITKYRYQGITFLNNNYGTGMIDALGTTGEFSNDESKNKMILMMSELKEVLSGNIEEGGTDVDDKMGILEEQIVEENFETPQEEEVKVTEEEPAGEEVEKKFVKTFEISHSDIRYALYMLLDSVEVEDNEWYFIADVYDSYFIYSDWDGTKHFKQEYKVEEDVVSFEGDRIELFRMFLTAEEKKTIDKLRGEYEALVSEFNEYKGNHSTSNEEVEKLVKFKEKVIQEERDVKEKELFDHYDELIPKNNAEYAEVKKNKDGYTIEDLHKEISFIHSKANVFSFGKKDKLTRIGGGAGEEPEVSPYGNIIKKKKE